MGKRLYSVFRKEGKKWVRLSELAFHKATAVRVFQSTLLDGSFNGHNMALRVVKPKPETVS